MFLTWVNCYSDQEHQLDKEFFHEAGAEELVKNWDNLVQDAERQERGTSKASSGKGQKAALNTIKWFSGPQPKPRNNKSKKQK